MSPMDVRDRPAQPGDGSGICEPRPSERPRPERGRPPRDAIPERHHDQCESCGEPVHPYDSVTRRERGGGLEAVTVTLCPGCSEGEG